MSETETTVNYEMKPMWKVQNGGSSPVQCA